MRLSSATEARTQEKLRTLTYLERYRNGGTRTYSSHAAYTEAEIPYRPDSDSTGFALHTFRVPLERLNVYTAHPPDELVEMYLDDSHGLFVVHPQTLRRFVRDPYIQDAKACSMEAGEIHVIPSSSTRTLYVTNNGLAADGIQRPHPSSGEIAMPFHALKVHFPFRISRYTRRMRDEVIEQALNVSRELEEGIGRMDEDFAFLREVIGVAYKNSDRDSPQDNSDQEGRGENWGYLVRDMQPFPDHHEIRMLVPGFALYGRDHFDPSADPLLCKLMGDRQPEEFLLEAIMLPIIRHWIACFLHFGFLLEPHGQNVLFELDENRTIRRIVHRDLSVGIDMRRRLDLGLSSRHLNGYNQLESAAFHSIAYDRFMGGHFFDRLVELAQARNQRLLKTDFTGPCREEFARLLPDHAAYFPKTVWYFSEVRDRYNKPSYLDTGQAPVWRPIG